LDRLKLAVVGAGAGRGQAWLSTVKKMSALYELCAICDADKVRAKENASKWGCQPYTNLLEMLKKVGLDVVLCTTPPDANHAVACIAAEHGVNVIVEIPVAPTLPLANMMAKAAERNHVKIEVAENVYRWATECLKRKIIGLGLIGEVIHVRLWYTSGPYHGFNAIRKILKSEAERVLGYAGVIKAPWFVDYLGRTVETRMWENGVIEFKSGVVCLYEMPPHGHRGNLWEVEGTEGQIVGNNLYLGSGGRRRPYPFNFEYTTVREGHVLDRVYVETEPPVIYENPYKDRGASDNDEVARMRILDRFYKAVTEDAEPEYGVEEGSRDQELCISVRESALRGSSWVSLPLKDVTEVEKRMHEEYVKLYGHKPEEIYELIKVSFPRGGVRWAVAQWL